LTENSNIIQVFRNSPENTGIKIIFGRKFKISVGPYSNFCTCDQGWYPRTNISGIFGFREGVGDSIGSGDYVRWRRERKEGGERRESREGGRGGRGERMVPSNKYFRNFGFLEGVGDSICDDNNVRRRSEGEEGD
jgi:hypothetical protein